MKTVLLALLGLFSITASFDLENPGDPGVTWDPSANPQIIYVDEDNAGGRVKVVLVTGVQGTITVNVYVGIDLLDVQTQVDGSQVSISVNLLDYELLVQRNIQPIFNIDIVEDNNLNTRITASLNIVNLDDESPTLLTSSCTMDEEHVIDITNSPCPFNISDPDGFLNKTDFSQITGSRGESDIFEFRFKEDIPDNVYEAQVYLALKEGVTLDYETITLYTFQLTAKDSGGNPTIPLDRIPVIVQVQDIPDQPPQWDSLRTALTITEEEPTTIQVSAKDGDYGINSPINYDVEDTSGFVTINKATGEISIAPVDRDVGNDKIVFQVLAIEEIDATSFISSEITLIVGDIDDNIPVLSLDDPSMLTFEIEESSADLGLEIHALDIDLGENAIYNVTLDAENPDVLTAISIIPVRGYESTTLTFAVRDPTKLDYENEDWRVIELTVTTTGTVTPTNTDSMTFTINLIDINDEYPIFESDEYSADIREDVGLGFSVQSIKATDKDAEDIEKGLKHEILGTLATSILNIEELGGDITTKKDDAFDYEKQNEISVQIRATDAVGHTASTLLTIHVTDVNDENPRLLVSSTIEIEENQEPGTVLTTSITASDEDTTADLEFEIDWTQSYAMKNSRQINETINIQCLKVDTIPGSTINEASAKLTIVETVPQNTPDYEVFDSLYIRLKVHDKNTFHGSGEDSALIVIGILDLNDNPPVFEEDAERATRQVVEGSNTGTVITSVIATDADVGDVRSYSLEPADEDTPLWVAIDINTGVVTVALTGEDVIDCDEPVRYNLKYNVTARDRDNIHEASTIITIDIIDRNDNPPTMGDKVISIDEQDQNEDSDPSGTVILELDPKDADRDAPWNVVSCIFSSASVDVTRRFDLQDKTISIQLSPGFTLDREQIPQFAFDLDCTDGQGTDSYHITPYPRITINLNDLNDNKPEILNTDILEAINENSVGQVPVALLGDDKDDRENGNGNGLVVFTGITKIERYINRDDDSPQEPPPQDLILVENGDEVNQGILTINGDLKNYYGFLVLTIALTDQGTPQLSQEVDVFLEVVKYNYEEPVFVYPNRSETIYLQPLQDVDSSLKLFTGDPLPNIQATDQQNGKFGINFTVIDDGSGDIPFRVRNLGSSQGQLELTDPDFTNKPYTFVVTATILHDDNVIGAGFSQNVTVNIDFFNKDTTDPVFITNHEGSVAFLENVAGLTYQVERAAYTKPDLPDDLPVFYLIKEGDRDLFLIDKNAGIITLSQELDYEKNNTYTLVLQSSNTENLKQDVVPETQFTLTVNVIDVNDNPPVFNQKNYVSTLLVTTITRDSILQVEATDIDTTSEGQLRYDIYNFTASDDTIKQITKPFEIDNQGNIRPNFTPKDSYKGYFTLIVVVRDEDDGDDHLDTAEVNIYLVTDENMVRFTFENDQDEVRAAIDSIKLILDENFATNNYVTHVEDPTQGQEEDGSPRTIAQVYFLDTNSNAPIEATDIYKRVTDVKFFNTLRQDFAKVGLFLLSFDSDTQPTENLEATLKAWLIGVSVVLGALCLILLIAFILKTRALNQRINKLSNTKFGSQESGLNRTGVAAPTTNKHAVEGSNPVYNNDVDTKEIERRISVTSGDSDLIGIEDDDKFGYNNNDKSAIFD